MVNTPEGMKQIGAVVGGENVNLEGMVAAELKDPKLKVIFEDGNAYIFGPAVQK